MAATRRDRSELSLDAAAVVVALLAHVGPGPLRPDLARLVRFLVDAALDELAAHAQIPPLAAVLDDRLGLAQFHVELDEAVSDVDAWDALQHALLRERVARGEYRAVGRLCAVDASTSGGGTHDALWLRLDHSGDSLEVIARYELRGGRLTVGDVDARDGAGDLFDRRLVH